MRQRTTPLLCQCPICGQGEIALDPSGRRKVANCPSCGATLVPSGAQRFRLNYCAPHKLGPQGCRRCAGNFYNTCFLDRALPLSDWERMARRMPPAELEAFFEQAKRFESGELPSIEEDSLSGLLRPDEVVHHFSQPVFTEAWYMAGRPGNGGRLFVTNQRLLFCTARVCSSLLYEDFEELREERPGFYVILRGEREPHYFFPPPLDPVYYAVVGALKNFRQKGRTQHS